MRKILNSLLKLFKRKEAVIIPPQKTEKELAFERLKQKYKLEYSESIAMYFVKYFFNDQWYYLRRWDYDFGLEETRGRGIVVRGDDEMYNQIIREHQEWIAQGHVFLPYK